MAVNTASDEGVISEGLSLLPPLCQRVVRNAQLCRRLLHADFIGQLTVSSLNSLSYLRMANTTLFFL